MTRLEVLDLLGRIFDRAREQELMERFPDSPVLDALERLATEVTAAQIAHYGEEKY